MSHDCIVPEFETNACYNIMCFCLIIYIQCTITSVWKTVTVIAIASISCYVSWPAHLSGQFFCN